MQKFGWLSCLVALLPFFGVAETYTLAGKDESNASAMNGTGSVGWTDSLGVTTKNHNPSVGNDYVANGPAPDCLLRTPTLSSFTFGGDSLTLSGGVEVKVKIANNGTVTIPNLIVAGGAQIVCGDGAHLKKVAGAIDIQKAGALKIDVSYDDQPTKARQFEIQSTLSGSGSLWTGVTKDGTSGSPYVKFTKSLADFTGRIIVHAGDTMRFVTRFNSNFPGDPAETMADGLTLEGNAALEFGASGTLGATRGISLGAGTREIYVDSGKTVQINGLLTGSGGFRKTGAGTLALASVSPELTGTVTVEAGTLQLCGIAAEVLPNATITVSSGALDENGPACGDDTRVVAELKDVRLAEDGQAHGPELTVTDPAEGWQAVWSTDGVTYTSERPTFTDPGEYPVFCRISANGYMTRALRATVLIGVLRRVVATEAEQTGDWANATVAGDDAWAAIQGVIDGCGVGDLILVKAGSYLLTNELAFASAELRGVTLRSDDGEGNLARKTTLLIGGYPATSNRLVRIATPEVIVEGFTLTNGFVNAAPGGGAYLDNCGAGAGLRSCDIVGCTAWNESYLTKDVGFSNGTGGGAYVYNTGCISNCLFKSNVSFAGAVSLYGTQNVLCPPKDTPWVTHCEFVWNEQIGKGTANQCNGSAVASRCACCIDHCSIVSNFCNVTSGVQISTVGSLNGYLIISNCVFRSNGHGKRKDMLFKTNSSSTIRCVGNTFIEEVANPILGSIDSWGCDGISMFYCAKALGSTNVKNSFFYGNTNSDGCVSGACTVQNCTFVGNRGAIYSNGGAAVASRTNRVVNCVFYGNVDDIYAINDGNAKPIALFVSNCCIRASSLDQKVGSNRQFGLLVTNGCNIVYGGGNMDLMTLGFVAPSRGDFRLREGSLLVDAGMTLNWMDGASDGNGLPRVVGLAPDIGCYERQEGAIDPPKSFVRAVAKEEDKKGEWAEAYVGLQAAADAACGETVYVKAGAYDLLEPVSLRNFGVIFVGEGPGKTIVDGGYPTRTNRLFTITQGGIQIKGMTLQNSAVAADGGAILVSHDDFTLDSCVVSNCCAGFNGGVARYGGGVYVDSVYGNVLLTNTLFTACQSRIGCGVACCTKTTKLSNWATRESVPVISACEFVSNAAYPSTTGASGATAHPQGAGAWGVLWVEHSRFAENALLVTDAYGAVLALDANAVATNCLFEGHTYDDCAILAGRGDCLNGGNCRLSFCTFRNNAARRIIKGSANVENCVIVSNAFTKGNDLSVNGTSLFRNCLFACNTGAASVGNSTFENCTFATNEYGICHYKYNDAPTLRNCVSLANTGTVSRLGTYYGTPDFCFERAWSKAVNRKGTYEANVVLGCRELPIYGGAAGETFDLCSVDKTGATSNIVAIVEKKGFKFVDPAKGNWRLRRNSPLRDAALPLDWMTDSAVDLDGKPRRISSDGKSYPDSLPDIGCYECDIPKPGFLLQVW